MGYVAAAAKDRSALALILHELYGLTIHYLRLMRNASALSPMITASFPFSEFRKGIFEFVS